MVPREELRFFSRLDESGSRRFSRRTHFTPATVMRGVDASGEIAAGQQRAGGRDRIDYRVLVSGMVRAMTTIAAVIARNARMNKSAFGLPRLIV